MSTPRHRLIWDAMVTRFQGITVANGFNTDVRTVVKSPGEVAWTNVPPAVRPWIGIISQPRQVVAQPGAWKITARFDAVCVVTASTEGEKHSIIDGLEDDILEAIGSDIHWGTHPDDGELNAQQTDLEMVQVDDTLEPRQGALIVSMSVIYYRKRQVR